MTSPPDLSRVAVVGTSGSGKTTFARDLAAILDASHVELDALHWLENWQERDVDSMRALVATEVAHDHWVIDGNYSRVRDLVWARATTLVWLNYSVPRVLGRATWRTIRRVVTREPIFGGNRESFFMSFFSRDSILVWVVSTYGRRRREYGELLRSEPVRFGVIEFTSPAQAARFLREQSLGKPTP